MHRRSSSAFIGLLVQLPYAPGTQQLRAFGTGGFGGQGKGGTPFTGVETSSTDDYMRNALANAVKKGRLTGDAAQYVQSLGEKMPQLREVAETARGQIGGNDPEKMTSYQQQMFGQVVSMKGATMVATEIQRAQKEQQDLQTIQDKKEPTGENYWMESQMLMDTELMPEVRDQILDDMKQDRPPDSTFATEAGPPMATFNFDKAEEAAKADKVRLDSEDAAEERELQERRAIAAQAEVAQGKKKGQ